MKPLTNLEELIAIYWAALLPGFQKVLEYASSDMSLAKIMAQLMSGQVICWIWEGTEGRLIDGFTTTRVDEPGPPGEKYLVIYQSWVHPDVQPLTLTQKTHDFFEGYAKELKCNKIKVYSLRDIGRWMSHYGFKPSYVEYEKEVTL
jgi:hypothetical protein